MEPMARRAITRRKPDDPRACAVSRCSGLATLAFLATHCAEFAAAGDPASAQNNLQLAELIVTAQKRTEEVQSVPISAQVIGAQLALLATAVRPVHAEDEMAASGTELQEVTVTAQKREQRPPAVPISAQVASGRALAQRNFTSLDALTQTVPGLLDLHQGP